MVAFAGRCWRPSRTALHLRADLDFDEWVCVGRKVAVIGDSAAWWIADWLIFGRRRYPRRYSEACAATGLDYKTLRNYACTASRVEPSRRQASCSFGHHAEVAALPKAEADEWLCRCARERWSRSELRTRLHRQRNAAGQPALPVSIALAVQPERRVRWESAASVAGASVQEWIETTLDRAAEEALCETPAGLAGMPLFEAATRAAVVDVVATKRRHRNDRELEAVG